MRGHGRAARSFAVIVAVAAVVGAGGLPASGAVTAKTPKITVTPSTGLKPGQTVHVKGSGFAKQADVVGLECLQGATDPVAECDISNFVETTTDAAGAFTTTVTLHRRILDGTGWADCASVSCVLLFSPGATLDTSTTAALAFDPSAPFPPTSVSAKPSTALADRQTITAKGKGFTADGIEGGIEVIECVVKNFACGPTAESDASGDGTFSTPIAVRRDITDSTGTRIDCAKKPGTCELVAVDFLDGDYLATTAIAFDPTLPPPPPPTLVVKPDSKLPYYARVAASGKNWDSQDFVILSECAGSGQAACAFLSVPGLTDDSGAFRAKPMLQRELPDLLDPSAPAVDCAKPKSACVLEAQDLGGDFTSVPVTFDAHSPIPPPPTLSASPAAPYRNNQVVHVKGTQFPPRAAFGVSECAITSDDESCFSVGDQQQVTSAAGGLSTLFQVERNTDPGFPDNIDCTAKGTQCLLEASSEGGAVVDLPITFKSGSGSDASGSVAHLSLVSRRPRSRWLAASSSRSLWTRRAEGR